MASFLFSFILVDSRRAVTASVLCAGAASGEVKVWDVHQGYCTHVFRGSVGVIGCVADRGAGAQGSRIGGWTVRWRGARTHANRRH